jgi:hypothetical protein
MAETAGSPIRVEPRWVKTFVAVDLHTRAAAAARTPGGEATAVPRLSWIRFPGLAVSSIGGPIALPTLLPGAAGASIDSAGLVVSLAVFVAPLAIWWRFSERVVSPGGLRAFVDAAAGRRPALVQAWSWAVAYFLYLPLTVTYVV